MVKYVTTSVELRVVSLLIFIIYNYKTYIYNTFLFTILNLLQTLLVLFLAPAHLPRQTMLLFQELLHCHRFVNPNSVIPSALLPFVMNSTNFLYAPNY
jgi:hypothetical protein